MYRLHSVHMLCTFVHSLCCERDREHLVVLVGAAAWPKEALEKAETL